ncbi:hypothetical protein G6O69_02565 [Pseudenhygromyxa sp. WMMC2535]|uniref:tetratricopeptide repeat protein n=1 Tax=Pseudenhygromyxa sp. WMMC2535 TaxID=2712867 RepID=UPI00155813B5|nr:hypothetical protein [Pseudenhygromyxa sp. WMMC2535]NVB36698.1 hypothetical protein [Pseudenhygromyxa sp. WMMC2535]
MRSGPVLVLSFALSLSACAQSCGQERAAKGEGEAADAAQAPTPASAPAPVAAPALAFARDDQAYRDALADLDWEIAAAEARAEANPRTWLVLEKVAGLHLQRARLSGSYDDYAAAEDALTRAFERAAEGSGPLLTRAALNFSLHRLDRVEADLDIVAKRPVLGDPTRARIESMRGAVDFERGDYEAALAHFEAVEGLDETGTVLAQRAQWYWRHGDIEQAEALYRRAGSHYPEDALEPRAWTELQLGIIDLERGRYEDAFEHCRAGAGILGGWWLLEEHIAEIAGLLGHREQSLALYAEIIARTGKGEFMDARAALLREDPSEAAQAEADALIERAGQTFAAELERYPEASYGHALGHYLEFGPADRALELAEANHRLRPGVPAKIALAEARLASEDPEGARAVIDEALATGWSSAALSWTAAEVYAALEDEARAAKLRAQAKAINPHIGEP